MSENRQTDSDAAAIFASGSLLEHALRGLIGFGALMVAVDFGAAADGWWTLPLALGLAAIALIAFRGCPVCWSIGLLTTLRKRLRKPN